MTPRAVLIGPPGAGKSTIGRRLAQALDLELLDTDVEIERRTGRTIPEIFATDGEPHFRELEEQVVGEALEKHDGILSLGGGAILSERTRTRLAGIPWCTWRSVSRRASSGPVRPPVGRCSTGATRRRSTTR